MCTYRLHLKIEIKINNVTAFHCTQYTHIANCLVESGHNTKIYPEILKVADVYPPYFLKIRNLDLYVIVVSGYVELKRITKKISVKNCALNHCFLYFWFFVSSQSCDMPKVILCGKTNKFLYLHYGFFFLTKLLQGFSDNGMG